MKTLSKARLILTLGVAVMAICSACHKSNLGAEGERRVDASGSSGNSTNSQAADCEDAYKKALFEYQQAYSSCLAVEKVNDRQCNGCVTNALTDAFRRLKDAKQKITPCIGSALQKETVFIRVPRGGLSNDRSLIGKCEAFVVQIRTAQEQGIRLWKNEVFPKIGIVKEVEPAQVRR